MRLAAIDIGSNAARLLISDATTNEQGKTQFQKLNLVRVPLRLGFDVFEDNTISKEREEMIMKTIRSYKLLIDVYGVEHMKACATSAMRDAANGPEIIKKVKEETGIEIEIITGDAEASLIYEVRDTDQHLYTFRFEIIFPFDIGLFIKSGTELQHHCYLFAVSHRIHQRIHDL